MQRPPVVGIMQSQTSVQIKIVDEQQWCAASCPLRGQKRRFGDVRATSALPLKADIHRMVRHVSKVPFSDSLGAVGRILSNHISRCREQRLRNNESEAFRGPRFAVRAKRTE
jgi:hypothetical protein